MESVQILIRLEAGLLYFTYLFLPGYMLVRVAGLKENQLVISVASSLCFLVVSQIPYQLIGGPVTDWYWYLHGTISLAVFGAWIGRIYFPFSKGNQPISDSQVERMGLAVVGVSFAVYHFWVGPYTEIPSDFWTHLGQVFEEGNRIEHGGIEEGQPLSTLWRNTNFVHFLHGAVAQILNVHPLLIVREATLVTSLALLLVFYAFTLRVTINLELSRQRRVLVAVLATVLLVVCYGVATFSYIRYYAYFPHLFNMILFFSVVLWMIECLEKKINTIQAVFVVGLLLLIMVLVNRQEALFALIFILGISITRLLRTYSENGGIPSLVVNQNRVVGYVAVALVVVGIFASTTGSYDGSSGYPHLIDLGPSLGLDWKLLVANPSMRFWDTLAPYGVIVYLWYALRLSWFKGVDYIQFGMLSPVVTLMNPLFVWWFLHVSSWDPLWRLALLMPLSIVGAILIVKSLPAVGAAVRLPRYWINYALSMVLVASLMPWNFSLFRNTGSRIPSLVSLNKSHGAQLWWDLIDSVDKLDGNRRIVTDPVTHYVLSSATSHGAGSPGKAGWQYSRDPFSGDFKDRLLYYGMDGALVIVNERDGLPSQSGAWSGHWSGDILAVSTYYPEDLKFFLESKSLDFKPIWRNDGITAYVILRNPMHY